MSLRDDRIELTDREWRATCEAVAELQRSVEKLERENLVFKAKAAVVMTAIGTIVSIAVQVVLVLIEHKH
jgi:hypothetical protein